MYAKPDGRSTIGADAAVGRAPDLTGIWQYTDWIGNYMGAADVDAVRRRTPCNRSTIRLKTSSSTRLAVPAVGLPVYKPELWDKIQELDMWTNKYDPVMTCQPLGVPRQGPPRRSTRPRTTSPSSISAVMPAAGWPYRIIPIDGRKHAENANFDATYMGVTVGRWEGDTLVLDSVGFIDTTWIGRGGFLHSSEMKVVENLRVRATRSCTT